MRIIIFSTPDPEEQKKLLRNRKILHINGNKNDYSDKNIVDIREIIKCDPKLKPLFDRLGILPIHEYKKNPYVSLIGAIVGQFYKFKAVRKIRSNIYSILGTDYTIEDIRKLTNKQLMRCGIDENKVTVIRDVNKYLKDISLCKDVILSLKDNIVGIGEWTVNNTLLTSMLDLDVMLYNDAFINKRLQSLYNLHSIPNRKKILEISKNWIHKGIICWYLWRDF